MSEHSWVLKGIDPAARQQAVEEAARRGIPLGDYLTDIVLQNALAEQMREHGAALVSEFDSVPPVSAQPGDGFAVRHRLKALERRLGTSVTSLDGALNALDTSLFDLSARVGDVEGLAGDTAHAWTSRAGARRSIRSTSSVRVSTRPETRSRKSAPRLARRPRSRGTVWRPFSSPADRAGESTSLVGSRVWMRAHPVGAWPHGVETTPAGALSECSRYQAFGFFRMNAWRRHSATSLPF